MLVSVVLGGCAPVYRYSMAYCAQEAARAAARELSPFEQAEWLAQRGCNVVQAIDMSEGVSSDKSGNKRAGEVGGGEGDSNAGKIAANSKAGGAGDGE